MSALRERILVAARGQFQRFGLAKTTMREIAAEVGVAVGTLYRYFDGKDALIAAFIEQFQQEHQRAAEAVFAADMPADARLRRYLVERFEAAALTRQSQHAIEIERAVLRVDPMRLEVEGREMQANIKRLLCDGQASGLFEIDDIERAAQFLVYALGWCFPLASSQLPRWPTAEELAFVLDWFLEQIKPTHSLPA